MRISDTIMETLLGRAKLVTPEQLTTLKIEAARSVRPLAETVIAQKVADEKTILQLFSDYTDVPFIELNPSSVPVEVLKLIPERVARQYMAVLFKVDENKVYHLAMEDPDDVQAVNFIQKQIGTNSRIYIATSENILSVLDMYRGDVNKNLMKLLMSNAKKIPARPKKLTSKIFQKTRQLLKQLIYFLNMPSVLTLAMCTSNPAKAMFKFVIASTVS